MQAAKPRAPGWAHERITPRAASAGDREYRYRETLLTERPEHR
jgi:hypothetical protein